MIYFNDEKIHSSAQISSFHFTNYEFTETNSKQQNEIVKCHENID